MKNEIHKCHVCESCAIREILKTEVSLGGGFGGNEYFLVDLDKCNDRFTTQEKLMKAERVNGKKTPGGGA